MNLADIESALNPFVKQFTSKEVKKIKEEEKENMSTTKKKEKEPEATSQKEGSGFADLREIVNIKKQKAVAGELDEFIYEQEKKKQEREGKRNMKFKTKEDKKPDWISSYFAQNPEKLKELSTEDAMKFAMINGQNSGGGFDPLQYVTLLGMQNTGKGDGDLTQKVVGMMLEKMFNKNGDGNDKSDGNTEILKYMMAQNLQTQNLMISLVNNKNANQIPQANPYLDGMVELLKSQASQGNAMVLDKIKELEMRSQGVDSLGEAKRVLDYFSSFKNVFGGANTSPEMLQHEKDIRLLEMQEKRQIKEDEVKDKRVDQIGSMINDSMKIFAEVVSKPAAEAIKTKLEGMGKQPVAPLGGISKEILNKEIDLGELRLSEANPTISEMGVPQGEPVVSGRRADRFRVLKAG